MATVTSVTMSNLPKRSTDWADVPAQLVSSRLEHGYRLASTPSGSFDSSNSSGRVTDSSLHTPSASTSTIADRISRERTESFMSTATVSAGILSSAKIATASTTTIRKAERTTVAARPIRFTKHRKDADAYGILPSSSSGQLSSQTDDLEEAESSTQTQDHTQSTVDTSLSEDRSHSVTIKSLLPHQSAAHVASDAGELPSFFSDTMSAGDSSSSLSKPATKSSGLSVASNIPVRRGSGHDILGRISPAPPPLRDTSNLSTKYGLGILSGSFGHASDSFIPARSMLGSALDVVPESGESPFLRGDNVSPEPSRQRTNSVATSAFYYEEPVWGQSSTVTSTLGATSNPNSMASFAFPGPAGGSGLLASLATQTHTSSAASVQTRHTSNYSVQSFASNVNPWGQSAASSNVGDTALLLADRMRHAPPSSYGGSIISSANTSTFGLSTLFPTSREDMLQRLLVDQVRIDVQAYGIMSIEEVADAQRELKQIERKLSGLRTKLKVDIKIRDAAVALRKAHRKTLPEQSPTSSSFPGMTTSSPIASTTHSSNLSISSRASRGRGLSISASEAKAEEDVTIATAKVDKTANELFKLKDRASDLRRKILEHQAAALSERVHLLESDRQNIEEKLSSLASSSSLNSIGPSASASVVGFNNYRAADHRHQESSYEPYVPQGPHDPLRHSRLESDLSAISGFSFLDASAPEKVRRLAEELERKREGIKQTEEELETMRKKVELQTEDADKLQRQLEQERQRRLETEQELRTSQEQVLALSKEKDEASSKAAKSAVIATEQKMRSQLLEQQTYSKALEQALTESKAEATSHQQLLVEHRNKLEEAQRSAEALLARAEAAEKAALAKGQRIVQLEDDLKSKRTRELRDESAKIEAMSLDLDRARAAQTAAEALIPQLKADLERERQTRVAVEYQLASDSEALASAKKRVLELEKQTTQLQTRAKQGDAALQELELAVAAERRIMAERDGLFHAFERRLESAEKRLQEQDKRCARMLGKLEGREEMDDLLERIKAGASGQVKKSKTAGQDIAGLLTSLETHIGDLELELSRAGSSAGFENSMDSAARSATQTKELEEKIEMHQREAQRWKAEAEEAQRLLQIAREQEAAAAAASATESGSAADASPQSALSDEVEARVKELEEEVARLTQRGKHLEAQLRGSKPSSPLPTVMNLRPANGPNGAASSKGVGDLISRFGGGRKATPDRGVDDNVFALHACIQMVATLRSMLPDLAGAAAGSADLQAIREAFEPKPASSSSTPLNSPKSARSSLAPSAVDLQVELEAVSARLKSTLEISRAVIQVALDRSSDLKPSDSFRSFRSVSEVESKVCEDCSRPLQEMQSRLDAFATREEAQMRKEQQLEQALAKAKRQLALASERPRLDELPMNMPISPMGTRPEADSMLGLSTSPSPMRWNDMLLGMPPALHRTKSNSSMRSQNGNTTGYGVNGTSAISLAPPRSPNGLEPLASPTRSNYSAGSSPSIRYIPPFAPSSFELKSPSKANASISVVSAALHGMDVSDSVSGASIGSPSSINLVLSSSATSASGTPSARSKSLERHMNPATQTLSQPSGAIKRTITLGMDVPQLVAKVRELEKQLAQTASIRKRADRVGELEIQLREAHQAYARLIRTMEEERSTGTYQKVEILNELNETQSRLQTTKAQIERAQYLSPSPSPSFTLSPLPPPKD